MNNLRTKSTLLCGMASALAALALGCAEDNTTGGGLDSAAVSHDGLDTPRADALNGDTVAGNRDVPDDAPTDDSATSGPEGDLSTEEGLIVVDLPAVETDETTGLSEVLTVDIPEGGYAISISVTGPPERWYTVHNIVAPDGSVLAGQGWMTSPTNQGGHALCLDCANRISASTGAGAVLVPITPSIAVQPGTYRFQLASFDVESASFFEAPTFTYFGSSLDVKVVIKHREGGLPETGVLDLNLFFTGAGDLDAADAPADELIIAGLQTVSDAYSQVGVSIGNVTYTDIDEAHQFIDGIAGEGNDFEAAAAQTEGAPPGVNVIFVEEIVDSSNPLGGFGVILGVSGGIPGPIGMQGSSRSAVIVDITPPAEAGGAGGLPIGTTMAHEMGHFLGLFHSSELPFLGLHDPLADTAENDTTNLMYFEASATGSALSADQGRVIRSNGWVRHPEEN